MVLEGRVARISSGWQNFGYTSAMTCLLHVTYTV